MWRTCYRKKFICSGNLAVPTDLFLRAVHWDKNYRDFSLRRIIHQWNVCGVFFAVQYFLCSKTLNWSHYHYDFVLSFVDIDLTVKYKLLRELYFAVYREKNIG